MKFLVVISVLAVCATSVTPFFLHGGKKTAAAPVSEAPAPVASGGGGFDLAGLGNIVAIPLGIKKQLLISHQKKINQKFDHLIGFFNKFSSNLGGSSSSANAGAGAGSVGVSGSGSNNHDFEQGTFDSHSTGGGFDSSFDSGNSFSSSSGSSSTGSFGAQGGFDAGHGGFDAGFSTGGSTAGAGSTGLSFQGQGGANYNGQSSGSFSQAGGQSVQTYHPQPAPNTQYSSQPITLHLYQVDVPQAAAISSHQHVDSAPAFEQQVQLDVAPEVPTSYDAPPSGPSNVYGPPGHNPSPPINTYLPPSNCNNPTHRH